MKFNFCPTQELNPVEKSALLDFSEKINAACNKTPNCDTCILKDLCDEQNVPDFIQSLFDRLGI
jgi:endonuclease III